MNSSLPLFDAPSALVRDICAGRHRNNPKSKRAFERIKPKLSEMQDRIRIFVVACDFRGATVHEIAAAIHDRNGKAKLPHQISGRLSELKAAGLLFDSNRERGDAAVLVGRLEWVTPLEGL